MKVQGGPYDQQEFRELGHDREFYWFKPPPGWRTVLLTDEKGDEAVRDVPERYLRSLS